MGTSLSRRREKHDDDYQGNIELKVEKFEMCQLAKIGLQFLFNHFFLFVSVFLELYLTPKEMFASVYHQVILQKRQHCNLQIINFSLYRSLLLLLTQISTVNITQTVRCLNEVASTAFKINLFFNLMLSLPTFNFFSKLMGSDLYSYWGKTCCIYISKNSSDVVELLPQLSLKTVNV